MPRDLPHHPFSVVRMAEENLEAYTGAPHAVLVESCTSAIYLACKWWNEYSGVWGALVIPRRTYIGVPQSIQHAGLNVIFTDAKWTGSYQLQPYPIWDCARRFTRNMYVPGQHQCLSFHWEKICGAGRGGAILTDDAKAAEWYRSARCDGRHDGLNPREDTFIWGLHAYMTPEMAAAVMLRLFYLPDVNPDQSDDYPDLSQQPIFGGQAQGERTPVVR